jgi:hypothetical protein
LATIAEEITSLIERLWPNDQKGVLELARGLANPPAFLHTPLPPDTPGEVIAQLRVSPVVGEAMERALEECERVDSGE